MKEKIAVLLNPYGANRSRKDYFNERRFALNARTGIIQQRDISLLTILIHHKSTFVKNIAL